MKTGDVIIEENGPLVITVELSTGCDSQAPTALRACRSFTARSFARARLLVTETECFTSVYEYIMETFEAILHSTA